MVQKVGSPTPAAAADRVAPAPLQPGVPGAGSKHLAAPIAPATQLHLSETHNASAVMPGAVLEDPLDAQLIHEIRQRIDSGKFQIDFDELAANILREAIASAKGSQR